MSYELTWLLTVISVSPLLKMKILFAIILSVTVTFQGSGQTQSFKDGSTSSLSKQELRFANHYTFTTLPAEFQLSKNSNLSEAKKRLPTFGLCVPDKLPMFCALEKKLTELCNVWIKIRLPEKQ